MTNTIQKTPGGNSPDERRAGASYTQNERKLIDEALNRVSDLEANGVGSSGSQTIDGGNAYSRP